MDPIADIPTGDDSVNLINTNPLTRQQSGYFKIDDGIVNYYDDSDCEINIDELEIR
jgi:hypothetical protein